MLPTKILLLNFQRGNLSVKSLKVLIFLKVNQILINIYCTKTTSKLLDAKHLVANLPNICYL